MGSLDGGLSSFSWIFQLCECQCWYNRTLKRKQSSFGEESLSNIFPGQLELNALLWPPNKESIIIIYHIWLLLIAQYNKIELHKSLYNEACGWSSLRAEGRLDSLVHFCPVLWLCDATWGSEHGDWDMWRARSCQHHPGITGETFSILVMLDFEMVLQPKRLYSSSSIIPITPENVIAAVTFPQWDSGWPILPPALPTGAGRSGAPLMNKWKI